ncbi:MAG: LysR family transcriptional regulator [Pseudomonadota bacterium]
MTYRFPSLNGLKAFEAAARHLSFRAAAGELGVTSGAVSQQVKRLEASLGVALFRRLPQGLLLTEEGHTYLPRISEAFDILTEATEGIAPALNGRKLSIGIAKSLVDRLPRGWPRRFQHLDAYVRETLVTEDVELIWSNDLDALLLDVQTRHGGLTERAIEFANSARPIFFVTRPGLANCRQSRAIIEDLEGQRLFEAR